MKCNITGIEMSGGLNELIPEYQKEIVKLRKKNSVLQDCADFYSKPQSWGNSGNNKINRIIDSDCSAMNYESNNFHYRSNHVGGKLARACNDVVGEIGV